MTTHSNEYIQSKNFARASISIVTDASGDFEDTIGPFTGYLDTIKFTLGTLTSGAADITVKATSTGETVFAVTNAAANDVVRPKILSQDTSAADLTGEYSRFLLVNDTLTVTVAQGGDTKTGSIEVAVAPA